MQTNSQTTVKRPRRRNKSILPVAAASMVAFLGLSGFLGAQMASGQDPLVGSGQKQTAQVQPQVVRKVVVTRKVIIKQEVPAVVASSGSAPAQASSGTTYSAPVQQSAPVQSAPVQSAPAPVQSGSS